MIALYFTILAFLLVIALLWWRNYRHCKIAKQKLNLPDDSASANQVSIVTRSIEKCKDSIVACLNGLNDNNILECCRVNNTFYHAHDAFCKYRRNKKNVGRDIYLIYLWDACLKVTELVRYFVSNRNYDISTVNTPDMTAIRDGLRSKSAEDLKSIVSESIRNHTASMSHKDYNDNSAKHEVLVIYHHLYSFIISLEKLTNSEHHDTKDTCDSDGIVASAVMG